MKNRDEKEGVCARGGVLLRWEDALRKRGASHDHRNQASNNCDKAVWQPTSWKHHSLDDYFLDVEWMSLQLAFSLILSRIRSRPCAIFVPVTLYEDFIIPFASDDQEKLTEN
jgi:hypothetical protein